MPYTRRGQIGRWACLAAVVSFEIGSLSRADEPTALRQQIDAHVESAWQRENITPAPPASDAEFLRRVYLDLVGVIPSLDETLEFLGDTSPDKRSRLIDRLLEDPRYAQHQADVWDLLLFGRNPPGYDTDKREAFQNWLREQFAANTPYDQIVRQILRAEGNTVDQGAPMYYLQYRNQPEDATEAITQTFLGVQLQCARCHDHPFESWTQLDFYGMAAFLARLQVVTSGKAGNLTKYAIAEKSTGDILFTGPASEQTPGKKGEPVQPKFLHGDALAEPPLPEGFQEVKFEANKEPPPPKFSRKDQLAEWIARPENPYFARAAANRVWAQYLGRGLVHPVDNMSESNKPSHPELLEAISRELVEHQFDLKWLVRELLNTRTYQLSSAGPVDEALPTWFQQARTRPLSAEELIESWRVATGYDAAETSAKKSTDRYRPLGSGYLIRFFGTPNNGVGDFQGGLHEHLYLNNGPMGTLIASGKGGLLDRLANLSTAEERVNHLFLAMLNRPPQPEEQQKFLAYLAPEDKPGDLYREATWVLMTCSEFRFNH
jgi:hypothetical protein